MHENSTRFQMGCEYKILIALVRVKLIAIMLTYGQIKFIIKRKSATKRPFNIVCKQIKYFLNVILKIILQRNLNRKSGFPNYLYSFC